MGQSPVAPLSIRTGRQEPQKKDNQNGAIYVHVHSSASANGCVSNVQPFYNRIYIGDTEKPRDKDFYAYYTLPWKRRRWQNNDFSSNSGTFRLAGQTYPGGEHRPGTQSCRLFEHTACLRASAIGRQPLGNGSDTAPRNAALHG